MDRSGSTGSDQEAVSPERAQQCIDMGVPFLMLACPLIVYLGAGGAPIKGLLRDGINPLLDGHRLPLGVGYVARVLQHAGLAGKPAKAPLPCAALVAIQPPS